jgi:hypothetical protein
MGNVLAVTVKRNIVLLIEACEEVIAGMELMIRGYNSERNKE